MTRHMAPGLHATDPAPGLHATDRTAPPGLPAATPPGRPRTLGAPRRVAPVPRSATSLGSPRRGRTDATRRCSVRSRPGTGSRLGLGAVDHDAEQRSGVRRARSLRRHPGPGIDLARTLASGSGQVVGPRPTMPRLGATHERTVERRNHAASISVRDSARLRARSARTTRTLATASAYLDMTRIKAAIVPAQARELRLSNC